MPTRRTSAATAVLALALAAPLTGCSDSPEGDTHPATVRVSRDREFDKTYQLVSCDTTSRPWP